MSYTSKNFTPSGTAPAAFEQKTNLNLLQVVKIDIGDADNETPVSSSNPLPVTATTLPLPSGAATSAKQDTGNTSLASIDGKIVACNTGAVVISSSALPSGAATSAKQDTGNTSVASIDTKTPALGQALAGGSVPVVLTAAQISTLTPLSTVAATQSGTWNVTNISGTVSLPTGASTAAKQPSLGIAGTASSDVITVQGIASMTALKVDGSAVTQPVSGTVTATMSNGKTLASKGGNAASSGNNTLVAAGTNKLKVYAFSLTTTSTTAVTAIFQSGASGTELWRVTMQAPPGVNSGANLCVSPPAWIFATASTTLLNLNLSAAVSVDWSVAYFDEA